MLPAGLPPVPAGYVVTRVGGRPRRDARDAALLLAKAWRMAIHGENAATAEQWIVEAWEAFGRLESRGISDTAHVRRRILLALQRGLKNGMVMFDSGTGVCSIVECQRDMERESYIVADGARSWHWAQGMAEAAAGVASVEVVSSADLLKPSAVASAIAYLVRPVVSQRSRQETLFCRVSLIGSEHDGLSKRNRSDAGNHTNHQCPCDTGASAAGARVDSDRSRALDRHCFRP